MDGNKFENSLSSASILKYEISSKFPCRSRSFDCRSRSFDYRSRRRNDGVCTALQSALLSETIGTLRWLPTLSIFDYFLFVERLKMKLGNSMFPRLDISQTNEFCEF